MVPSLEFLYLPFFEDPPTTIIKKGCRSTTFGKAQEEFMNWSNLFDECLQYYKRIAILFFRDILQALFQGNPLLYL